MKAVIRMLIAGLLLGFGCKHQELSNVSSFVGLEAGQDYFIRRGQKAYPTFLALADWFNSYQVQMADKKTGRSAAKKYVIGIDKIKSASTRQDKTGLFAYINHELGRIEQFSAAIKANDILKLRTLLDTETKEMYDIAHVILVPGAAVPSGDLFAQFIKATARPNLTDRFAKDFLQIFAKKSLHDIVAGLEQERQEYLEALLQLYTGTPSALHKFANDLERDRRGLLALQNYINAGGGFGLNDTAGNAAGDSAEIGGSAAAFLDYNSTAVDDLADSQTSDTTPPLSIFASSAATAEAPIDGNGITVKKAADANSFGNNSYDNGGNYSPTPNNGTPNYNPSAPAPGGYDNNSDNYDPNTPGSPNRNASNNSDNTIPATPSLHDINNNNGGGAGGGSDPLLSLIELLLGKWWATPAGPGTSNNSTPKLQLADTVAGADLPPEPQIDCRAQGYTDTALIKCERYVALAELPADPNAAPITNNVSPVATKQSFDLIRKFATPVQNQGQEGACTAFGMVHSLQAAIQALPGLRGTTFSAWDFWNSYNEPDMLAAVNAAGRFKFKAADGSTIRITGATPLNSFDEIIRALDAHQPLYMGSDVAPSWSSASPEKPVLACGTPGKMRHAYSIQGYKLDDSFPGGGVLIMKNSWGDDWGDHGYGYLPFNCCSTSSCRVMKLNIEAVRP